MSGKYRTIVADPPWPFEWTGGGAYRTNGRGERHLNHKFKKGLEYKTMSIEEIAALEIKGHPVTDVAAPDAHLYVWIPDCHLIEGHGATVCRAWGFEPGRLVIWKKTGYGLGTFPRPQHEALIVCRRGTLAHQVRDQGSVQEFRNPYVGGARLHSAKPDGMLDLIERNSPGPYLELFARRARLGWSYWGDESLGTAELPPIGSTCHCSYDALLSAEASKERASTCPVHGTQLHPEDQQEGAITAPEGAAQ